ncbi:MAG: hypothetical protein ACQERJ_05340 [Bacillota bacterium]
MAEGVEVQGRDCGCGNGILDCLEQFECETVICVLKSGGACDDCFCCCKQEGMVCDVNRKCGILTLLDDENKIFIPVDAIAAVIKKSCCC